MGTGSIGPVDPRSNIPPASEVEARQQIDSPNLGEQAFAQRVPSNKFGSAIVRFLGDVYNRRIANQKVTPDIANRGAQKLAAGDINFNTDVGGTPIANI